MLHSTCQIKQNDDLRLQCVLFGSDNLIHLIHFFIKNSIKLNLKKKKEVKSSDFSFLSKVL